jgi:uncharacterized membrane protein YeaQ/YmgE (transglycosylase-associated protein family)
MNMVFGSAAAMFGGELINKFGMAGMPWLNLWSVLVSVSGAALYSGLAEAADTPFVTASGV